MATGTSPPRATPAQIQRREALRRATARRYELAGIRAAIRTGQLTAIDAVLDPPAELADVMVWRILLDSPGMTPAALGELNHRAIRAYVNLAAPVRMLSTRQRQWLVSELAEPA